MQRRRFLITSMGVFAPAFIPAVGRAVSCPPPELTLDNGADSAGTGCSSGSGPAWVGSLSINTWTALPNTNTFNSVRAANIGQGDSGNVFEAWCGAALVTGFGQSGSMLHWGGGHTDYYGNEVYAFDLATLTWARLNEPSSSGGFTSNLPDGLRPDGTPGAAHTYYFVNGRNNELVITKRQSSDSGPVNFNKVSRFNPQTKRWTNSTASGLDNVSPNDGTCYDPSRDSLWCVRSDALDWARYNFANDTWTTYTNTTGAFNAGSGPCYVPTTDCVLAFTGSSGSPLGLDAASPTADKVTITTSGSAPSFSGGSMPLWSANLGAVVFYPSRSSQIYLLRPPSGNWRTGTWVWSQAAVSGTSGTHSGSNGTYGKFQVAEWGSTTVAVLNADEGGPCRAVRLA